jgi:hypothetical protein
MSEGSLAEREDLARGDTEHERLPAAGVVESTVAAIDNDTTSCNRKFRA